MAALLHALVIALLLYLFRNPPMVLSDAPPGITVDFDNSSAGAPPSPQPQPSLPLPPEAAPPAPVQPPQPIAEEGPPDVNLNVGLAPPPPLPLAMPTLPPLPAAPPTPTGTSTGAPHHLARATPHRHAAPPSKYMMLMGGMSFGSTSPTAPSAAGGLNLAGPETDAQAVAAPSTSVEGDFSDAYGDELHSWLKKYAYYPREAAEQNQQGTTVVTLTLHRNGKVTDLHLAHSAGSQFLDQTLLTLFIRNHLPKFTPDMSKENIQIMMTVNYQLIQ